MTQEVLKMALEALEELTDTEQTHAALERGDAAITALRKAMAQPEYRAVKTYHEGKPVYVAQPQQEPVAKPYAYEYGRDNGDGTYCVVIEKGDLIQTAPAVYNYVRPRNHHKDWPVKELFDRAPPQRTWVGLTNDEITEVWRELKSKNEAWSDLDFARAIEAAHGIKENT